MAALIRSFDWSKTSLGPLESWPSSLSNTVGLISASPVAMIVYWGQDGVAIYNDAYVPIAGGRHPRLLGAKGREGWPEVADFVDHFMRVGLAGGSLSYRDQAFVLERSGSPETAWFNVDASPVPDDAGNPGGVLLIITESTQRVLADRRATAEQERQRHMLQQMPGFVGMLSGPDLVYTYVNDAYVAISERTDFIGRRFRDVFADIAGQGFHELFESVFHTGEGVVTRGMELRLHGRLETQYVDFVLEPLRDDSGAVIGVFVGGYETTEVHRAAQALRASEARLRELNADLEREVLERTQARGVVWNVTPDLMGALNPDGFFETSNPAWQTTLGWSPEEVAGASIFDLLHPDDIESTRQIFDLTQAGQPALRFPNRYRCKDGGYRWISWVAIPDDGLVYCIGRDITQEKQAADERDRLWFLAEDMLARADYTGMMRAVNPAWTKVLGFSERELLTRPYSHFMHPDDVEVTLSALESMGRTQQATRFENRIRTSDDQWKPIGWTVVPEPDGVNFIAVGRDLSADKARARELLDMQDALRQSQKMDAMGQLTGGVAHDFNNLLMPIIGSLDMLQRRGVADARTQRMVDGALQSAERAKTLVQRLLAFARRQPLQPQSVDVAALIRGMEDLLASTVGPRVTIKLEIEPDLPAAVADANQLEMALLNLAVNARDAMPDGGTLTLAASTENLEHGHGLELRPGAYLRLCVHDTGVGMDEATRRQATEPFFSTKGVGRGTGLGLSMVHGLAAQLGGALTLESELGSGATIKIWLPLADRHAAEPLAPTDPVLGPRSGTVLLVDDEDLVRASTADMLADLGYRVVEAQTAEDAVRKLDEEIQVDILITDHLMPGMTGADLARTVARKKPGLPVLLISGYAEAEGVGLEFTRLTKPFRQGELAACLAELTSKH